MAKKCVLHEVVPFLRAYHKFILALHFSIVLPSTEPISITPGPSGTNKAGEQYRLSCMVIVLSSTPNFMWFGPPDDQTVSTRVGDTRVVSDVTSNGSAHTNVLRFHPLQSMHNGSYTCKISVGSVSKSKTIQVGVQGKS